MKAFRSFPTGWLLVTGLIIGLHFLHAQHAVIPVQYGAALPVVTKVNDAEVVQSLTAASRQIIYSLPAGDENDRGKFAPAFNFSTDSLWLQITGITNGMASLILNNATNQVYEVLSKTDLTLTNWTIEPGEVWPTNSTVMPFTVSIPDRTKALFIRAADWTGVTENGNTVPDWWFWKYFGTVALSDTNLDTVGNTLLTGSSNGWWALYLSPDGTQLSFGTSTNGGGMANLSANISWASNEWHQIALTYSPASSALYVDGQLLANGIGVTYYPGTNELANGFRIGSDLGGSDQAEGAFDELQTFDYPLSATDAATYDSQIPDWWEVKYFGRAGLDPEFQPVGDGFTLWLDYQRGRDPNVISFSLSATNRYVNTNTVPVQINVIGGEPVFMAIMVDNTNPPDAKYQPFGTTLNFSNAAWQPYSPNIIAFLNSGDGDYNVWVGVKGLAPDAQPIWQWMPLILDTVPPVLVVTNPVASMVARPMIQLQGYANKSLGSLTYDISNVAGVWTNQEGYFTGQFYDTNLRTITTNWFQCYDIVLATNGPNVLTLRAADLAGNPFTTNLSLTVDYSMDTNPPVFVLVWPQDGMAISGANFILQGSVSDPTATVMISVADGDGNTNIVSGTVARDGAVWANNVPLGNGTNAVTVTTTGVAGSSTANFALFRNDVGLTLNPLTSDQLNQSFVTISGSIGNSGGAIVVNGQTAAIKGDGTWTADVPVNSSGQAIFNAAVYDNGNNLIASQSFIQTQPAAVVTETFWRKARYFFYDWGWPYDGWFGLYNNAQGIAGPVFENAAEEVEWTHQSGGSDVGYAYYTGATTWGAGWSSMYDQAWDQVLSPGENLILNKYSTDFFGGPQWGAHLSFLQG
ncbi:MAG: LamG-like jellyroll fold domain-containing protein [Verrucomicrobiia bacterium]